MLGTWASLGVTLERVRLFGLGMDEHATLSSLRYSLQLEEEQEERQARAKHSPLSAEDRAAPRAAGAWSPALEFVGGVNRSQLGVYRLTNRDVVSQWAFRSYATTEYHFGIAGQSAHRDTFMLANALAHRKVYRRIIELDLSAAYIFEDDAVVTPALREGPMRNGLTPSNLLQETLQTVQKLDPNWDLVNLGRCLDLCSLDVVMKQPDGADAAIASTGQVFRTSPQSMCLHAYAISAMGARKMLSLSLPHVFPIDMLTPLLHRAGLLRLYSVSPLTFNQRNALKSTMPEPSSSARHRRAGSLPECDPREDRKLKENLVNGTSTRDADRRALLAIGGSWVSHFSPAAQACPRVFQTIARDQTKRSMSRCALEEFHCEVISGGSVTGGSANQAQHSDAVSLVEQMDSLSLRGALIWGLRLDDRKSQWFAHFHQAVYSALKYAFEQSSTPRHLCWVRGDSLPSDCSLDRLLGYESDHRAAAAVGVQSILGRSLVFASPKYMPEAHGWALTALPVDVSSAYIFHEVMPARFFPLVPLGRAVQWITGVHGGPSRPINTTFLVLDNSDNCPRWPCMRPSTSGKPATMVSALASALTPADIEREMRQIRLVAGARRASRTIALLGSSWRDGGYDFCAFAMGCRAVRVQVQLSSARAVGAALRMCRDLPRNLLSSELDPIQASGVYAFVPLLQRGRPSRVHGLERFYFPASAFDAAAQGKFLATNNPEVARVLSPIALEAMTFSANVTEVCGRAAAAVQLANADAFRRLQRFIWAEHTYVSRLNALVSLLRPPQSSQPPAEDGVHSTVEGFPSRTASGQDAAWCSNYHFLMGARWFRDGVYSHLFRSAPAAVAQARL